MNNLCFECGDLASHDHHVVPESLGGTRTVRLCHACHGKIHGLTLSSSTLTRYALQRKRARGERVGQIPYGYRLAPDGQHLEPEPSEQSILQVMRHERSRGTSLRAIVALLQTFGFRTRKGTPFLLQQVVRCLNYPPHGEQMA